MYPGRREGGRKEEGGGREGGGGGGGREGGREGERSTHTKKHRGMRWSYLHEQSMSIVNWVPQLKGKDGISTTETELGPELMGCETVLIQTIIPVNPLQSLDVSSHQPVT